MILEPLKTLKQGNQIYLDHNATTPVAEVVAHKVNEWLKQWGNASSIHQSGRGPKTLIRDARRALSEMFDCQALEIVFTGGGSEANNLVLKGLYEHLVKTHQLTERPRMITSQVEHPSVLKTMEFMASKGVDVVTIPVCRYGKINLEQLEQALKEKPTSLVSVMFANNETGSLFPIQKITELAHQYGALMHSDMVQALGKIPFSLKELNVDFASFSAHKFYALKGIGALYCKKGSQLTPLIHGGAQERGRRAGTENTLAIAAFGEMARHKDEVASRAASITELRDHLEKEILARISDVEVTGAGVDRLANSLSLLIPGVDGETLLMNLDMKGFSVSTGAACSSGSPEPSPVLIAMGLSREEAQSSLRLGLGWGTTREEVDLFIEQLVVTVKRLRSFQHGMKANG
ncbi:MAG: cysteine desulfurase [Bdellovibrionales bacterium]|nr:cysteine desulfurase [Bdellovibrionales bacterium]